MQGNGKNRWPTSGHCGSNIVTPSIVTQRSTSFKFGGLFVCFSIFLHSFKNCFTESRTCFGRNGGLITVEHKYAVLKVYSFSSMISGQSLGGDSVVGRSSVGLGFNEVRFGSLVYRRNEGFKLKLFFFGVSFRSKRPGAFVLGLLSVFCSLEEPWSEPCSETSL